MGLYVEGHIYIFCIVYNFIYIFHVPLFFITAGYFYKACDDFSKLSSFIIKRLKGLYIPFIKWSLAFLLLHNLFYYLNIYSADIGHYNYDKLLHNGMYILLTMGCNGELLGGFWFLKTLLLASCSVAIMDFITHKIIRLNTKYNSYAYLIIFIILTVLTKMYTISLPIIGELSRVCLGISFFVSGALIKQHNISLKKYQTFAILFIVFGFNHTKIAIFALIMANPLKQLAGQTMIYGLSTIPGPCHQFPFRPDIYPFPVARELWCGDGVHGVHCCASGCPCSGT